MSYLNYREKRDIRKLFFLFIPLTLVVCLVACENDPADSNDPPAVVNNYTVEIVQSGFGGTISPIGITHYEVPAGKNQVLVLTMTLEPGCKVDSMKINNTLVKLTGNTYSLLVDKDCKVEAYFSRTLWWNMIQNPWKVARFQRWNAKTMILQLDLRPPDIDENVVTFSTTPSGDWMKEVTPQGESNSQVELKDSTLTTMNALPGKVIEVSDKILILEYLSVFASQGGPDPTKDSILRITYNAVK